MSLNFLVPIDFTEATVSSLKEAYYRASERGDTIVHLLHISELKRDEDSSLEKLDKLVAKYQPEGISSQTAVRTGDVFEEIEASVDVLNIDLIFLGIHPLTGFQYLFGSKPLKMVTHSKVPFIMVQENAPLNPITNISVPINFLAEEKQQLEFLASVAEVYNAKIHIMAAHSEDEFSANAIARNVKFAINYLEKKGVNFEVTRAQGKQEFYKEFLTFAQEVNSNMISMINHHESGIVNLFGANFDQNIIANEAKIPVIIINTKDLSKSSEMFGAYSY